MPKEDYVPSLFQLFRQYGYDGATLAKMSEVTGLGKASLYHYFPGGKDEMVQAVLAYMEARLDQHVLQNLKQPGEAPERLQRMVEHLQKIYDNGNQPCVLAILLLGSARDIFHAKVQELLAAWIGAIAALLAESGMDAALAQQRGEAALITIQGSLILAQGMNDPSLFQRAVRALPATLCCSIDS
ncbi:MAG: TetR/AcrR family transcriptional regulator [Cyanobacteria bacterium J06626_18]